MHQTPKQDFESPLPTATKETAPPSMNEKDATNLESTGDNDRTSEQGHWLEGPQLIIVSMSVTLVVFLMLLDTNILSTVSTSIPEVILWAISSNSFSRLSQGYPKNYQRIPFS